MSGEFVARIAEPDGDAFAFEGYSYCNRLLVGGQVLVGECPYLFGSVLPGSVPSNMIKTAPSIGMGNNRLDQAERLKSCQRLVVIAMRMNPMKMFKVKDNAFATVSDRPWDIPVA